MNAEFLVGLGELAKALDVAVKLGGKDASGMPTPYLGGRVEVFLEGEVVGHFLIEDEWVIYQAKGVPA